MESTTNRPAVLRARAAQQEGDAERDRGGGVAGVVDEVGQQRDGAAGDIDEQLRARSQAEYEQCERDGAQPLARALDRVVDKAVRVAVAMPVRLGVLVRH